MKKLLLLLLFFCTPAMAADLYMSDCVGAGHTTGCWGNATIGSCTNPGIITNPICPDPGNDGTNELHEYLMNGTDTATDPELTSGETLFWCAGACDGSGSGTVTQETEISISTAGGWTVTVYPGENITIDGSGGSKNFDHFTMSGVSVGGWTYDGNDKALKLLHFGESNSAANFFFLDPNGDDVTITGMEMAFLGPHTTDVGQGTVAACDSGSGNNHFGVYMQDSADNVSTFTFTNNLVHHACMFAVRCNNHGDATLMQFNDNEFYNMAAVTNDFDCRNVEYKRNLIWDIVDMISIERDSRYYTIEDNVLECRGTYQLQDANNCRKGIQINETDTGGGPNYGRQKGHVIRRNIIRSDIDGAAVQGNFFCGINVRGGCFEGVCDTGAGVCNQGPQHGESCTADANCACPALSEDLVLIENNMLINIRPHLGSDVDPASAGCRGAMNIASWGTDSNVGVNVRHNTIYYSQNSLAMSIMPGNWNATWCALGNCDTVTTNQCDAGPDDGKACTSDADCADAPNGQCGDGVANHDVTGNLIVDCIDNVDPTPNDKTGVFIWGPAVGSVFTDNNVRCMTSSGNAVEYKTTTDYTCAGIGSWGTGNVCDATTFVNISGDPDTWDVHLASGDTNNIDGADFDCPTDDYDSGSRTSTCDIGADERGSPAGTDPSLDGGAMAGGALTLLDLKKWSCEMQKKHGVGACIP